MPEFSQLRYSDAGIYVCDVSIEGIKHNFSFELTVEGRTTVYSMFNYTCKSIVMHISMHIYSIIQYLLYIYITSEMYWYKYIKIYWFLFLYKLNICSQKYKDIKYYTKNRYNEIDQLINSCAIGKTILYT